MSFNLTISSIRARLTALWTTTPVIYPNENAQRPEPPSPWVMCEVIGNGGDLVGIGKPGSHLFLNSGLIWLHVFVPQSTGQQLAWDYAAQLSDIFRTVSFDTVQTYSPSVGQPGPGDEDGNWYRVSVSIPFEQYQTG